MALPTFRTRAAIRRMLKPPRWLPLVGLVLAVALLGRGTPIKTQASTVPPSVGTLRVAFDLGRDGLVSQDPATGVLSGVEVDLARALAAQLGRTFVPVLYKTGSVEGLRIYQGLKKHEWDIAFLPSDPRYANLVDFTAPYLEVDSTYLVPAGSSIQSAADVDRPGVRVAVQDGSAPDRILTSLLTKAQIQRADDLHDAAYGLEHGVSDVIAADRPTLLTLAQQIPGARVLADRFTVVHEAIAVPKGQVGLVASISAFVEQATADGTVEKAIHGSNARAVRVASPATATP